MDTNNRKSINNPALSCEGHGPRMCGGPFRHGFGGPLRGLFGHGPGGRFSGDMFARRRVPANIEETGEAFLLSLYASGLDKSRIALDVRDDVLHIRYQAPQADDGNRRFTRQELTRMDFEREFALNGKVRIDEITASYNDGVLTVQLPKTPEATQPAHGISVQ